MMYSIFSREVTKYNMECFEIEEDDTHEDEYEEIDPTEHL